MNAKYITILFDAEGKEIVRLAGKGLKKDAETALEETEFTYDHAEIKTIYTPSAN